MGKGKLTINTKGKTLEIDGDTVTVDGKKVSAEEAERLTGTTVVTDTSGPLNLGSGRQVNW